MKQWLHFGFSLTIGLLFVFGTSRAFERNQLAGYVPENELGNLTSPTETADEEYAGPSIEPQAVGTGWIYGYASASSVPQGGTINFHVSAEATITAFDIQIYRVGVNSYIPMQFIGNLPSSAVGCGPVGVPAGQESTQLGCNWPVRYTLSVPSNWPSGLYAANLLTANGKPGKFGPYILFIVREDNPGSTSNIVFQYPTNTWQAYNDHGHWSFYTDPAARLVTFDRPYDYTCNPIESSCAGDRTIPMARWLESEGYTVEYVASEDLHADPSLLLNYNLLIIAGHDEYWSKEIRDNIDNFISAGGNVAIFSGNTGYRQVRYAQNGRTMICYKSDFRLDPFYNVDNQRLATEFGRIPVPNWPENTTTGLGWRNGGFVNISTTNPGRYTVYRTNHWVFAGTNLADGDTFDYENTERVEVDGALFTWQNGLPVVTGADQTPLNFTILGIQPSTLGYATMGLYTRVGGGTVFNGATTNWPAGLWPQTNPDDYGIVRQISRNVINRLRQGEITPEGVDAVSFATPPGTLFQGRPITFTATITPTFATPPIQYTWNLGNGSPSITTTLPSLVYTYTTSGSFNVQLTAANAHGSASSNKTITVAPPPVLIESLSVIHQPLAPVQTNPVTFTTSITPNNATTPITYTWKFGDGSATVTTSSPTRTYTYNTAGIFTVTVTADNVHSKKTITKVVTVTPLPVAVTGVSINTPPNPLYAGWPIALTSTVAPVSATVPITYVWNFGDGTPTLTTTTRSLTRTFDMAGVYTVSVTAQNQYGQSTGQKTLTLLPTPIALTDFTLTYTPTTLITNTTVNFQAKITPLTATLPITYSWLISETNTALVTNSSTFTHTFTAAGFYTLKVTVSNSFGSIIKSYWLNVAVPAKLIYLPLIMK